MELRQLAYLDAVVREGGFGRAAALLHVAQPAVSVQIRKLETELGTTLLTRSTRRVALTHAGELFLARARRVLAALDSGALRADAFVCLPVGTGLRQVLDRHAAAAGFTPHAPFETTSLPRLRDLVAHGLGVALVARSVAEAPGPPVVAHPVAPEPVLRPVALLHPTTLGPAA